MSPVSSDAAVQAAAGRPRPVSPGVRWVQLRLLQLDGRQLGGAGTSLEEPLQEEEEDEGGTETGEEEGGSVEAVQLSGLSADVQGRRLTKRSPANA